MDEGIQPGLRYSADEKADAVRNGEDVSIPKCV